MGDELLMRLGCLPEVQSEGSNYVVHSALPEIEDRSEGGREVNITPIKVEAFRIEGVVALDPVDVILEDVSRSIGDITVACYGQAWTAYWASMGDRTIRQFVAGTNPDYLAGKLANGRQTKMQVAYLLRVSAAVIDACKELEVLNAAAQS